MAGLSELHPALTCERSGVWVTADGHFRIVRGGDRKWRIRSGGSTMALVVLQAAEGYRGWATLAEATERLLGSIYAEPHGWAHHVEKAYELDRQAVYARHE